MNSDKISNDLKASLFELTYIIDDYKRKEIMDMLCVRIKKAMHASNVVFSMYNKWQLDQPISFYASAYPALSFKEVPIQTFISYYNKKPNITIIDNENELVHPTDHQAEFMLKVHCQENFYGFILVSFQKEQVLTTAVLEKVRIVIEQFLRILYN